MHQYSPKQEATHRVASRGDIIKTGKAGAVQPRVQEPKSSLTLAQPVIVQKRNNGGESGRRAASSVDSFDGASNDDGEVLGLRGDIGEPSTAGVVVGRVGSSLSFKEGRNGGRLVRRDTEVLKRRQWKRMRAAPKAVETRFTDVAESTLRERSCLLGHPSGATNRSDEGARAGESGQELGLRGDSVRLAGPGANTSITGGEEDGAASSA